MAINRINETDLQDKLVSQLSNRPTDPRSAGGDNMTAQQVKARHDALGLLVKDKLNELLDALNNATVNGEPVTPLSDLITVVADGVSKSLTEWIEAKLTKNTTAGEGVHAYGVDDDGDQTMIPVSDDATEGAIPQYGTGGVLPVANGTADGHAVNKAQLCAAIKALSDSFDADIEASVEPTEDTIPRRDESGVVHGETYGAEAPGTALVNKTQFEPIKELALGASKAFAANSYSDLVTGLLNAEATAYKVGQSIYIGTIDVPDVWIYSVENSSVPYTYTTDAAFEAALAAGTLQIGYYTLRQLETEKVDLSGYATEAFVNSAVSGKANLTQSATRVFRSTSSDTPLYLRGNTNEVFLGFRDKNDSILGYFCVDDTNEPFFYDLDAGYFPLLISSNFKSSRVYDGYSRKIFKGSFGFLPDIGSSGSATFTFTGISGHSPSGTATAQTVVSHRLTAWFCTKPGKTGASGDSNYYKIVILTMPSSLLDLDAIGAQTFMVPKGNTVTLTVSGISSAKSISYIADGTWKNTTTGE